ncbi:MAG: ubiquitin fusion degradation protein UFD1-domain-containing protein [Monoraphidium minutum]|nr:MAG: ubiquitin fusion degradation protein UFD1-domain-containing protein [Monoraphidium minutum]
MLNLELKARASKLEREIKERSETEKRRREKERILAERQAARARAREEEQRERRLAQLAAEAAEEERRDAETEANRGVYWHAVMQAAPARAAAAAARGIKRAADKMVLPASVGALLMAQEAFKNGAMLFEVSAPNGARTHAGVLEFSSDVPEGVALLPEKVQDSLWGLEAPALPAAAADAAPGAAGAAPPGAAGGAGPGPGSAAEAAGGAARCGGRVRVSYRRLEKGTYVRLQPELRAFHDEVGAEPDAMKDALEAALHAVCALTEGDWVQVPFGGRVYNLRVLELQPEAAVSVIDTDIACDVGPSIETEGYLRAREEELGREQERLRQQQEGQEALAAQARADADAAAAAEQERAAEAAARRLRVTAEKEAALPPEPPPASPHAALAFRLPDGGRLQRRFAPADALAALFDFVDSQGGGGLWPGEYRLVSAFPRRVVEPPAPGGGGSGSLEDAGLGAGAQAAFLLEPTGGTGRGGS